MQNLIGISDYIKPTIKQINKKLKEECPDCEAYVYEMEVIGHFQSEKIKFVVKNGNIDEDYLKELYYKVKEDNIRSISKR